MNISTKIATFVVGLGAVFAATLGVGTLVGPVGAGQAVHHPTASGEPVEDSNVPGGLMVSDQGYTLELTPDRLTAGPTAPLRFIIRGSDGRPVTTYERSHDKDLHLIAVRRDLSGFQHVHPVLGADGAWSVPLALTPGQWRVFADFVPAGGEGVVLGADLAVAGAYQPEPLPAASRTASVDGYTVTLNGTLEAGRESELTLSIGRGGRPVTDLEPYLGAYGHLVALRDGDLAYLHVHPAGHPGDGTTKPGPDVTFYATTPSVGTYRLYLDFQHAGKVRTAEFTVIVGATAPTAPAATPETPTPPSASATGHGDHGGHR